MYLRNCESLTKKCICYSRSPITGQRREVNNAAFSDQRVRRGGTRSHALTPAGPRGLGHHWRWPTPRSGEAGPEPGWCALPQGLDSRRFTDRMFGVCTHTSYRHGAKSRQFRGVLAVSCDASPETPVVPCPLRRGDSFRPQLGIVQRCRRSSKARSGSFFASPRRGSTCTKKERSNNT